MLIYIYIYIYISYAGIFIYAINHNITILENTTDWIIIIITIFIIILHILYQICLLKKTF